MIFFQSPLKLLPLNSPLNGSGNIPKTQTYISNTKLASVKVESKSISNIRGPLNVCKAHGCNNISMKMLNICDSTVKYM